MTAGLGRAAVVPLLIGALLGFIAGYFAAGGGRPGAPSEAAAGSAGGGRIAEIERSLERDPENPKLWTALGNAQYDRENWPEAIRAYEKARRAEFSGKWKVERLIGTAVAFPALINRAARVLSRRKDMADLLVGVTGDFVPAREVLRASYLLPFLLAR